GNLYILDSCLFTDIVYSSRRVYTFFPYTTLFPSRNQHARQSTRKEWLQRLDRVAGDLNVLLVLVAIGLATLDATMLFSQRLLDRDRKSTRLNSSHDQISYAVFCLKKRKTPTLIAQ